MTFFAIVLILAILLFRFMLKSSWSREGGSVHADGVPAGRRVAPAKIEQVPDEFAGWESRIVRFEPGEYRDHVVMGIDVRGRFPITEPTQVVLAASVFDVEPGKPDDETLLAPVLSVDPGAREDESPAFHCSIDFGVADPGTGFRQWAATIAIVPVTLVPPEEGTSHYRILLVAFDASRPPKFDYGVVEGDVLWAGSHDFRWEFEGEGYRTTERERVRVETRMMEFAISAADPTGKDPLTRTRLEDWIAKRANWARLDPDFDRPGELNAALTHVLEKAGRGEIDIERNTRALLASSDEEARNALGLAFDLLIDRDGTGRIAGLIALGERLQIPRADVQVMIDKRVGGLAREETKTEDLRALLGINPEWDKAQVKSHLTALYMQWNSRAESMADPAKRAEAEAMLERIACLRADLDATSGH